MTTAMLVENGYIKMPIDLIQRLGWQVGNELELFLEKDKVIINHTQNKPIQMPTSHQQEANEKLINQAFGIVKAKTPKGFNLLDFDVADHITLFDEADE